MTQLIVTPIDRTQPGSRRVLRRVFQLGQVLGSGDAARIDGAFEELDVLILQHCHTDDGTPVDEAFDDMSWVDYLAAMQVISDGLAEGASVPPLNGGSSPSRRAATGQRRNGSRTSS